MHQVIKMMVQEFALGNQQAAQLDTKTMEQELFALSYLLLVHLDTKTTEQELFAF